MRRQPRARAWAWPWFVCGCSRRGRGWWGALAGARGWLCRAALVGDGGRQGRGRASREPGSAPSPPAAPLVTAGTAAAAAHNGACRLAATTRRPSCERVRASGRGPRVWCGVCLSGWAFTSSRVLPFYRGAAAAAVAMECAHAWAHPACANRGDNRAERSDEGSATACGRGRCGVGGISLQQDASSRAFGVGSCSGV